MRKKTANFDLSTLGGRLGHYIYNVKGATSAAVAKQFGTGNKVIDTAISGVKDGKPHLPNTQTLLNFIEHFGLNPSWVMLGIGPITMAEIREQERKQGALEQGFQNLKNENASLQRQLREKEKQLSTLIRKMPGKLP